MEVNINGKSKKGLFIKTWERCRSIGVGEAGERSPTSSKRFPNQSSGIRRGLVMKSRSWPGSGGTVAEDDDDDDKCARKRLVAPEGFFSVYVGPQKQRFVVKTQYANHPLFKMLLEEAELEYGYSSEGPLALPCDVDFFHKVLVEMADSDEIRKGCKLWLP